MSVKMATRKYTVIVLVSLTICLLILDYKWRHLLNRIGGLEKKLAEIHGHKKKLVIEVRELRKDRKKNLELERKLDTLQNSFSGYNPLSSPTVDLESEPTWVSNRSLTPPSKEFLTARRRTEKTLNELWYFISSEVSKVNMIAGKNVTSKLQQMMGTIEDMHHVLSLNFDRLKTIDGQQEWAKKEHKFLGDLVQRRLYYLQNPHNCSTAKKLVCRFRRCGIGCEVHHLLNCFIVAYGLERTAIIDFSALRYSSEGWNRIFKPLSETCTTYQGHLAAGWNGPASNEQNVLLPYIGSIVPRPKYMSVAVPKDLAGRIDQIHGQALVWWVGQFAKYLFRYAPEVQDEMDKKKTLLGFKKPIVGVQVRRTDKINNKEAAFHSIQEYMNWVDLYYNKLERLQTVDHRRVYLATDDPNLLSEAKEKYKNYAFISDNEISKSAGMNARHSKSSLQGIVFDIQILSECDYLVCTFSSNVCRLAYELMQSLQPDASNKFQSLDDIYFFHGQSDHDVQAIYPHKSQDGSQIDLDVGDRIGMAGNHWDGYSKGVNRKTGQVGLFPSYKVEEVMEVEDFPIYEGV